MLNDDFLGEGGRRTPNGADIGGGLLGVGRRPGPTGTNFHLSQFDRRPTLSRPESPRPTNPQNMKKAIDDVIRRDIVPATFLGVPIEGGAHQLLVDKLVVVEDVLNFRSNGNRHGVFNISGYQGIAPSVIARSGKEIRNRFPA